MTELFQKSLKPSGKGKNQNILTALGSGLTVLIILGGIGSIFAIVPERSILGLVTVWTISIIISIGTVWDRFRPNWWARLTIEFNLSILILAGAIHWLGFTFASWFWFLPLLGVYLFAWALPSINPYLAKFLYAEQFTPKTRIGKGCVTVILLMAGVAGPLGVALGHGTYRLYGEKGSMVIVGILFATIAIALAQGSAYQLWSKRPWSTKRKNN